MAAIATSALSRLDDASARHRLLTGVVGFSNDVGLLLLYLESLTEVASRTEAAGALSAALARIPWPDVSSARLRRVLDLIASAREQGVDVMFDVYPYTAYQTGLSNLFPTAMRAGGTAAFLERLRGPDTAARLERACRDKVALLGDWNSVQIASADETWARGRRGCT